MIVLTFLVRRRREIPAEEFHRYWRDEHGPLVQQYAGTLGIRRYVQLHASGSELGAFIASTRDCDPGGYDGIAVLWFDDEEALVAASSTPEGSAAAAALLEDERRFLDLPRCHIWCNHEEVLVT